jgi:hypothetical protein
MNTAVFTVLVIINMMPALVPIAAADIAAAAAAPGAVSGGLGQITVKGTGVYVYKNVGSFKTNIIDRSLIEGSNGAHYYVLSPSTTSYTLARGVAVLPTGKDLDVVGNVPRSTSYLPRIPCIYFSLIRDSGVQNRQSLDLGIQYRKQFSGEQGWFATYWSPSSGTTPPREYFPGAATVKMLVERRGSSIIASYEFRDSAGNLITGTRGRPGTTVHTIDGRSNFGSDYGSATPMRWARFMSFVPNNGASNIMQDKADMTQMTNAL